MTQIVRLLPRRRRRILLRNPLPELLQKPALDRPQRLVRRVRQLSQQLRRRQHHFILQRDGIAASSVTVTVNVNVNVTGEADVPDANPVVAHVPVRIQDPVERQLLQLLADMLLYGTRRRTTTLHDALRRVHEKRLDHEPAPQHRPVRAPRTHTPRRARIQRLHPPLQQLLQDGIRSMDRSETQAFQGLAQRLVPRRVAALDFQGHRFLEPLDERARHPSREHRGGHTVHGEREREREREKHGTRTGL